VDAAVATITDSSQWAVHKRLGLRFSDKLGASPGRAGGKHSLYAMGSPKPVGSSPMQPHREQITKSDSHCCQEWLPRGPMGRDTAWLLKGSPAHDSPLFKPIAVPHANCIDGAGSNLRSLVPVTAKSQAPS
jgi:hypothetical protein